MHKNKRVLLVEDSPINKEIAVEMLESAGVSVDAANDGIEALQLIDINTIDAYDMIFLDIVMPKMDGYELATKIRAYDYEAKRIPIVAMSADDFEEHRERIIEAGIDDYLVKPIRKATIEAILKKYIH